MDNCIQLYNLSQEKFLKKKDVSQKNGERFSKFFAGMTKTNEKGRFLKNAAKHLQKEKCPFSAFKKRPIKFI